MNASDDTQKWEYLELKITHGEVELVDGEFVPPRDPQGADPYEYIRDMIAQGWQLVTRSGALDPRAPSGVFSVVLKRPLTPGK